MHQPQPDVLPPPRPLAVAVLVAMLIVFWWTVGGLAEHGWRKYGTGWDLAIFDQAVWLAAHGRELWLTTRNIDVFSHHLNLWLWPVAGLYRLWPTPLTLIWLQAVAVGLAAVPVYLYARDLTRGEVAALAWAWLYLSYPATQYLGMTEFYFESLAVPLLTTAIWLAHRGRWRAMWVVLVLALLTKEDTGLAVAGVGLWLLLSGRRRQGWPVLVTGLGYTLVAIKLVMPAFARTTGRAFYLDMWYAHLGDSLGALVLSPVLRPTAFWGSVLQPANLTLLRDLLLPLAVLPLAAPGLAAGAGLVLWRNLISEFSATHTIVAHYQALAIPFVLLAAAAGGAWWSGRLAGWGVRPAVARCLPPAAALTATFALPILVTAWLPDRPDLAPISPVSMVRYPVYRDYVTDHKPWAEACDRLLATIPPDASVSAQVQLVAHISGRERAYLFPCPFYWGIPTFDDPEKLTPAILLEGLKRHPIDYLLLRRTPKDAYPLSATRYQEALRTISESGLYELAGDIGEVVLYRRRG